MGFWTVRAVSAQGSLEPKEEGSEQCLGRHSRRVAAVLSAALGRAVETKKILWCFEEK